MSLLRLVGGACCALWATTSIAEEALTQASAEFIFKGERISIILEQEKASQRVSAFAGAAPYCGETCLGPVQPAPGISSLGEREVLAFLTGAVVNGTGLMVDARVPEDRAMGYIPGSVNLPHNALDPHNIYQHEILLALGAEDTASGMDVSHTLHLLVYDVGPATNDSEVLIMNLLKAGYPADKISYYRGGMLMWSALGLSMAEGS